MTPPLEMLMLGEIVAQDPRAAEVLEFHGLDYCCNDERTLMAACNEAETDLQAVIAELLQLQWGMVASNSGV